MKGSVKVKTDARNLNPLNAREGELVENRMHIFSFDRYTDMYW